jgi:hypothetical protein
MTEQCRALAALCNSLILTEGWVSSGVGFDVKVMRKTPSLLMQILIVWLAVILLTELL